MIRRYHGRLPRGSVALPVISLITVFAAFFREAVVAFLFGASAGLDTFLIALSLPKLIAGQALLVLGAVIVPKYIKLRKKGRFDEASSLASQWIRVIAFGGLVSVAVLALLAPNLISILGPGLSESASQEASRWFVALLPYLWFSVVLASLKGVLESHRRFIPPGSSSLIMNLSVVASCVALSNVVGLDSIALGLGMGAAAAAVWQFALAARLEPELLRTTKPRHSIRDLPFAASILLMLGSLAGQARVILDRAFLSHLDTGSIAAMNFAETLTSLPTAILTSAIATVLLPVFATLTASGAVRDAFFLCLRWVIAIVTIGLLPVAILIVFRSEIVSIVFERGAFDAAATLRTSSVMVVLPLMILFSGASLILNRLFIALDKIYWLTALSIISLTIKLILNWHWIPLYGIVGAAFATVVAAASVTLFRLLVLWRLCTASRLNE